MCENKGILIGVGVGPGDPELVTLKAVRMIGEADRIILPQSKAKEARAYKIALGAVPALTDKCLLGLDFPMTRDKEKRDRQIRANYEAIRSYLAAGEKLAFLTIGDPCIYSTFCYLKTCAEEEGYATALVNGIPSFVAAAARWNIPLCLDDEEVHLLNGKSHLARELALPGSKIVMKAGRCLGDLADAIEKMPGTRVYAVKDCGLPSEEIFDDVCEVPEDYMVTVIVKERPGQEEINHWDE